MTPLNTWAQRWNIPEQALRELTDALTVTSGCGAAGVSEASVQQQIRLETSRRGARLFRNNNGACRSDDGRQIRYGLGNDSSQVNAVMKSSDLIGITPVFINGVRYGIFTSYEVKRPGWKYSGSDREIAQNNWLMLVTSLGGIARFVTDVGEIPI